MVYFLVGTNLLKNSSEQTWKEVQNAAALNAGNGKGKILDLEKEKFRMGNLDSLMFATTQMTKLDTMIEGQLKKVERQVQDLNPDKETQFRIETRDNAGQDVNGYLRTFKWDDSKFPRNTPIAEIIKEISKKVHLIEADLRSKIQNFQDKKNLLSQVSKKEGGNLQTKDLADVLKHPVVDKKDFVYSEYLTTLVGIVSKQSVETWTHGYESFAEYVVPGSAKQLGAEDKDGYTMWRVVLFKSMQDDFIQKARQNKITVREFKYDPQALQEKESQRVALEAQIKNMQAALIETCERDYSELYIAYTHLKVLKLLSDCVMRYGINDKVVTILVEPAENKEKKIHQGLLKLFADPKNLELYGTKEEIDDAEDFYPYAFVKFNVV